MLFAVFSLKVQHLLTKKLLDYSKSLIFYTISKTIRRSKSVKDKSTKNYQVSLLH